MELANNCQQEESEPSILERAKAVANTRATLSVELLQKMTPEDIAEVFHNLEVHQIELEMQNNELIEMQTQLNQSKDRYCKLYNSAPVGYFTLDDQNIILHANLTAHTLLEHPPYALTNQPFTRFIVREDQDQYYLFHKNLLAFNGPSLCELRMLKGNTTIWVCMSCQVETNSDGIHTFNVVINDITKNKAMEEKLRTNEEILLIQSRQAAMGEMISMIAHQWRQPLNIIGLAISNIEMKRALNTLTDTEFNKRIELINNNITFMSETIDDFRHFFQPNIPAEDLMLGNVIQNTLDIIGKSLENNNISVIQKNTTKKVLPLYKNQLIQVLINLINNAKDTLLIHKTPSPTIMITTSECPDGAIISVCDNGGGIPEEIMNKISEPYFTTKGFTGTGLGLHIARSIIERNFNGTLTWHNEKDGACFVLTLKAL